MNEAGFPVTHQSNEGERRYRAFISYSHADGRWGDWLHKALETYRVPKALVGQPSRTGPIPQRLYPIFRDREELPTAINLGEQIEQALTHSDYLIVICSPRSAKSRWVNEEILQFKRLGRSDRILAMIVDDEPNASDIPGREHEECFPPALRFELAGDGELGEKRTEPIAADAREGKDGKRKARLKLIAGLLGIGFDKLAQRERQRQRQRYWTLAFATAISLALGVAIWFEVVTKLQVKESERALSQLKSVIENGQFVDAMSLARASKAIPDKVANTLKAATLDRQVATPDIGDDIMNVIWHPERELLVVESWYDGVEVLDTRDNIFQPVVAASQPSRFGRFSMSPDGRCFYQKTGWEGYGIRSIDECKLVGSLPPHEGISAVAWHGLGESLLVGDQNGTVSSFDGTSLKPLFTIPGNKSVSDLIAHPGSDRIVAISDDALWLYGIDGDLISSTQAQSGVFIELPDVWMDFVDSVGDSVHFADIDSGFVAFARSDVPLAYRQRSGFARIQDATIVRSPDPDDEYPCWYVAWVAGSVVHLRFHGADGSECRHRFGDELVTQSLPLPTASEQVISASFCGSAHLLVIGGSNGTIAWLDWEKFAPWTYPRMTILHHERHWTDSVTAIDCHEGEVMAGFRMTGIKRFDKLPAAEDSSLVAVEFAEPSDDGRAAYHRFPTSSARTSGSLAAIHQITANEELGYLEGLRADGSVLWRTKVADTLPYRTGSTTEKIDAYAFDEQRAWVWAVLSTGRVILLEAYSGAIMFRTGLDYWAASAPPTGNVSLFIEPSDGRLLIRAESPIGSSSQTISLPR